MNKEQLNELIASEIKNYLLERRAIDITTLEEIESAVNSGNSVYFKMWNDPYTQYQVTEVNGDVIKAKDEKDSECEFSLKEMAKIKCLNEAYEFLAKDKTGKPITVKGKDKADAEDTAKKAGIQLENDDSDDYGITHYDIGRGYTSTRLISILNSIKPNVSDAGFAIINEFAKGAAGFNRFWILEKLDKLFSGKIDSIKKTDLRSYSNTDLFKLFDTGDIKQIKPGVVVANKSDIQLESHGEQTGLLVFGRTQLDNTNIAQLLDDEDFPYHAEWDNEGYYFFPETEENYDELEYDLTNIFNREGINARIEGVFPSTSVTETLDAVGKEDSDINNDGEVDSQDDYLKHRRDVISKAIESDKVYESVKKQFNRYLKGVVSESATNDVENIDVNDSRTYTYPEKPEFQLTQEMSDALNVNHSNKDIEKFFDYACFRSVVMEYKPDDVEFQKLVKEYSTRKGILAKGMGAGKWQITVNS